MNGPFSAGSKALLHNGSKFNADDLENKMLSPRHLIMTATLAVAFLSAGAFAQERSPVQVTADATAPAHITVISKS